MRNERKTGREQNQNIIFTNRRILPSERKREVKKDGDEERRQKT